MPSVVTKRDVTLTITRDAREEDMTVEVEIPGIGTAHFFVQAEGPVILRGRRGGIDFGVASEPVIECYGLTPAETIELEDAEDPGTTKVKDPA